MKTILVPAAIQALQLVRTETILSVMRLLFAAVTPVILALAASSALACDRPRLDLGFMLAGADAVFLGKVVEVLGESSVRVQPTQRLKGSVPAQLVVDGVVTERKSRFEPCQALVAAAGTSYLFAVAVDGKSTRLIEPLDGLAAESDVVRFREAIAQGGSASEARENGRFRARLLAKKRTYKLDESLDLMVELENVTREPQKLEIRFWPREKHTYCDLAIEDRSGRSVSPASSPIDTKAIDDYFSKNANNHDVTVLPGRRHRVYLQRVTTAKPGWGYKEDLGFQYYPLPAGVYQIRAICHHFGGALETNAIGIELQ